MSIKFYSVMICERYYFNSFCRNGLKLDTIPGCTCFVFSSLKKAKRFCRNYNFSNFRGGKKSNYVLFYQPSDFYII